ADVQPGGRVRLGDQAERAPWRSMDTCPRDGTVVRLRWGEDHVSPGWWSAPVSPVQNDDGTWPSDTGGFPWAFIDFNNGSAFVNHAVDTEYGPTHWAPYAALSAQPSPGGQGEALLESLVARWRNHAEEIGVSDNLLCQKIANCTMRHAAELQAVLAARQPVGEPVDDDDAASEAFAEFADDYLTDGNGYAPASTYEACSRAFKAAWPNRDAAVRSARAELKRLHGDDRTVGARRAEALNRAATRVDDEGDTAPPAHAVDLEKTFQAGVAEWMGQCFLPSLYSNMTERGDRLLEEVLELLQAHGYDRTRVSTLVDYVFGRPVGEPVQEVGGVMVTLAGYCWVAGLDMHANGQAELDRINQPDVMAKIRAKQEAKNALHFDTPLPGDPAATEDWPREGDLVRYGDGSSALAIRLGPHAGGWHGYQCCGGYTFFTKAYRPSRADMDMWLDCAKYRDERTKVADNRVAHEMYLFDSQAVDK
ncbi:TPA: hypothetical protein ACKQCT_004689, partial [Stenotrophomonas maltophilia]